MSLWSRCRQGQPGHAKDVVKKKKGPRGLRDPAGSALNVARRRIDDLFFFSFLFLSRCRHVPYCARSLRLCIQYCVEFEFGGFLFFYYYYFPRAFRVPPTTSQ